MQDYLEKSDENANGLNMSTLREIAVAASVHVATASAVLHPSGGNTRVSTDTRRRVLLAAKRLAYVPNESARRLRTGRSNVVGFLGGDLRNPFFAELTAALEAALAQRDLPMMVSHVTQSAPEDAAGAILRFRQQSVNKIVRWEESAVSRAQKNKTGESILSIGFSRREKPGVWLDLEDAIQGAVVEMSRRGFTRLGFFYPRGQRESPSVAARSGAFVEVCQEHSLARPHLVAYPGESWDLLASVEGARQALHNFPLVEGWIGFNDVAALGLLRCLPPKWSSRVVCFDGTILARCWPGSPAYLDLKMAGFAEAVASVISGEQRADVWGRRERWFRPALAV